MPSNGYTKVTEPLETLKSKGSQGGASDRESVVLSPRLLSYSDAGIYMSLSQWSLRTLVTSGQIPFVKFGKKVLIDVQDLNDWISRNKEQNKEWGT